MIIKGLFRRYERWNPVHPTYGAFWGMGVGIGCGIGWGPGFGPEVVGHVGAGCGVGFSVGFTLAGVGVGLPANFIFQAPYKAFMARRGSALESAQSNGLLSGKHVAEDSWIGIVTCVSDLQREAAEKFSSFRQKQLPIKGIGSPNFSDMKNKLPLLTTSAWESFHAFHNQLFSSHRGKDG